MPATPRFSHLFIALSAAFVGSAQAQPSGSAEETTLNPVVVTGSRVEADSFDLPYSVDAVDMTQAGKTNLNVNVSEALGAQPGLVIQNRQNYAQDLQISIRGFGARSAFGVRGVKLITDGIPASNPDGQGQAATFNLDTAERIEVLRGPFSSVYGNHAGGVIQLFSRDGEGEPRLTGRMLAGAWGTTRFGIGLEGASGNVGYVIDASRFDTDGYRDHSAARRDQGFAKITTRPDADSKLTLIASGLRQADTQDPLGVTWNTWKSNPRAVESVATQFNTRKSIDHLQGGATYERRIGESQLQVVAYAGRRSVIQYQAIPVAPQAAPRHAGGVIDFDRNFQGFGARWSTEHALEGKATLTLTAGFDYDRSEDDRRGYENFIGTTLGVKGALRRNEIDTVTSLDPYLQAVWKSGPWQAHAGIRHSRVDFEVDDRYITGANGDDSGSVDYRRTTPALGLMYAVSPVFNLYVSAGAGFETPTLNELSYATPTTGFNFGLSPSRSKQLEAGVKAFVGDGARINAALFEIRTKNEIVVAESVGGRTSYTNAGETLRRGFELSAESALTDTLTGRAALTWLDASYDRAFVTNIGGTPTTIPAGNHLPGVPRFAAFGELAWQPMHGLTLAAEALHRGKVYVNDLNDARPAPAYTLINLRLSAEQTVGRWTFSELLRLDNVFDREHIGSVIVGAANGRYYEPGLERSWYAGISAGYRF